ncbi:MULTISPECIES: DUF5134 domain-containing protein [unclassified Streptomyces]|uniref:DUF5134 domain-containing protein n=1 Tax=unclassified Streptomyces TaxID=2593676 RepID=UPI001F2C912D|nr:MULTISPECIES: DUF5134 domain-containing protein [unclassified Streptomyces]MCU4745934.1 DUF5134 domain-containing protein [Streptomyces sp. G-5]
MHEGPVVVGWLLVALCGSTGLYCLYRAVAGPGRGARRPAGVEGAMGLGMAVMAVPGAGAAAPGQAYVVFFGVLAGCSALLRARPAHRVHHVVEALAMVYMGLAMLGPAGHGAGGVPVLTGVLLAYFALYALRTGALVVPVLPAPVAAGAGPVAGGGAEPAERSPEVAAGCRLALSLGMLVMLVSM